MKDFILLICLVIIAAFGYWILGRLDKFLEENRRAVLKQGTETPKPYIVLQNNIKGAEIEREVERFRIAHSDICIVVCNPNEFDYSDFEELRNA